MASAKGRLRCVRRPWRRGLGVGWFVCWKRRVLSTGYSGVDGGSWVQGLLFKFSLKRQPVE
eukprot:5687611-Pyramimonas_sp.AAC.1